MENNGYERKHSDDEGNVCLILNYFSRGRIPKRFFFRGHGNKWHECISGWQFVFITLLRDKGKGGVCEIRNTRFSIYSTTPFLRKELEQ